MDFFANYQDENVWNNVYDQADVSNTQARNDDQTFSTTAINETVYNPQHSHRSIQSANMSQVLGMNNFLTFDAENINVAGRNRKLSENSTLTDNKMWHEPSTKTMSQATADMNTSNKSCKALTENLDTFMVNDSEGFMEQCKASKNILEVDHNVEIYNSLILKLKQQEEGQKIQRQEEEQQQNYQHQEQQECKFHRSFQEKDHSISDITKRKSAKDDEDNVNHVISKIASNNGKFLISKSKDKRYLKTLNCLKKAGLLNITLQTGELVRKSNSLQKDIDMLEEIVKVTKHLVTQ